jgi:outer membrane protein assembly factor BamB
VGTIKNKVYALDANNGNVKWEAPLQDSNPLQRPVAHGIQNTPVIDTSSQLIYVLFKTGNRAEDRFDFETDADTAFWLVVS